MSLMTITVATCTYLIAADGAASDWFAFSAVSLSGHIAVFLVDVHSLRSHGCDGFCPTHSGDVVDGRCQRFHKFDCFVRLISLHLRKPLREEHPLQGGPKLSSAQPLVVLQDHIRSICEEQMKQIQKFIHDNPSSITITVDTLTDVTGKSFLSIVLHCSDGSCKPWVFLLGFRRVRGPATAKKIKKSSTNALQSTASPSRMSTLS